MAATIDEDEIDNDESIDVPDSDVTFFVEELASSFVAKLYAIPNLSRSVVQNIIDETHDLLDNISSVMIPSILNNLKKMSVDKNMLVEKGLKNIKEPFKNMETEYYRLKKFKSSGHYVQAKDYVVGTRFDENLVKRRIR